MFLQPQELAPGKGRGISLVGTLACKVEKCADGIHVVECHLLTGTEPADVVFVEAWAGQAQRLCAPSNGDVVKLTHPIIKELGEKANIQASSNQTYIIVAEATTIEILSGSGIPKGMPIRHMPT